jgi:hypothetical protein
MWNEPDDDEQVMARFWMPSDMPYEEFHRRQMQFVDRIAAAVPREHLCFYTVTADYARDE